LQTIYDYLTGSTINNRETLITFPKLRRGIVHLPTILNSRAFISKSFYLIGAALVEIIAMWLSILWMIKSFYGINKTASLLQKPYICWVSFATLLNASIYYLN
jgi:tryptophan-rich sensory protein